MDMKSTFLNSYIAEEVYVEQSFDFKNYIFKLNKALYGLK